MEITVMPNSQNTNNYVDRDRNIAEFDIFIENLGALSKVQNVKMENMADGLQLPYGGLPYLNVSCSVTLQAMRHLGFTQQLEDPLIRHSFFSCRDSARPDYAHYHSDFMFVNRRRLAEKVKEKVKHESNSLATVAVTSKELGEDILTLGDIGISKFRTKESVRFAQGLPVLPTQNLGRLLPSENKHLRYMLTATDVGNSDIWKNRRPDNMQCRYASDLQSHSQKDTYSGSLAEKIAFVEKHLSIELKFGSVFSSKKEDTYDFLPKWSYTTKSNQKEDIYSLQIANDKDTDSTKTLTVELPSYSKMTGQERTTGKHFVALIKVIDNGENIENRSDIELDFIFGRRISSENSEGKIQVPLTVPTGTKYIAIELDPVNEKQSIYNSIITQNENTSFDATKSELEHLALSGSLVAKVFSLDFSKDISKGARKAKIHVYREEKYSANNSDSIKTIPEDFIAYLREARHSVQKTFAISFLSTLYQYLRFFSEAQEGHSEAYNIGRFDTSYGDAVKVTPEEWFHIRGPTSVVAKAVWLGWRNTMPHYSAFLDYSVGDKINCL